MKIVVISNEDGLHARLVALLCLTANKFKSEITILKGDVYYNAKDINMMMSACIEYKDRIIIEAKGTDSDEAELELGILLENMVD